MVRHIKKPELLAPAGTYENAEAAIRYGADAIYQGITGFSLRSGKKAEVSLDIAKKTIQLAHKHNKKYYSALNIFAYNENIQNLMDFLPMIKDIGIDGFIVADPGILLLLQDLAPNIPIHLSTQSNTLNYKTVAFWKKQGIKRIILARELNKADIKEIKNHHPDIELEVFIHGAMCMSYSGRCNLSLYMANRDANQGDCSHPCRWEYDLVKPGTKEPFTIEENSQGVYIMNSKDMNLAKHIASLIDMNITSLKIEGRNKTSYYIANTTRVYRKIIDEAMLQVRPYTVDKKYLTELDNISHRIYTDETFTGHKDVFNFDSSNYIKPTKLVGIVQKHEKGYLWIEVRDEIRLQETIEIILPNTINIPIKITKIINAINGKKLDSAHNSYTICIPFDNSDTQISLVGLLIRKNVIL